MNISTMLVTSVLIDRLHTYHSVITWAHMQVHGEQRSEICISYVGLIKSYSSMPLLLADCKILPRYD